MHIWAQPDRPFHFLGTEVGPFPKPAVTIPKTLVTFPVFCSYLPDTFVKSIG